MGRIVQLKEAMQVEEAVRLVKEHLVLDHGE